MKDEGNRGAMVSAGTTIGIGLGGFVDGIVLHQIVQWHHMLSSWVDPNNLFGLKYNMVWDGLFHAFTWIMTAVGLGMLWRAVQEKDRPWSTRTFVGSLVLGAGLFDFVEGLIDHQILGVHHVHPGADQLAWDIGYLVLGAVLIAIGAGMILSEPERRGPAAGA